MDGRKLDYKVGTGVLSKKASMKHKDGSIQGQIQNWVHLADILILILGLNIDEPTNNKDI